MTPPESAETSDNWPDDCQPSGDHSTWPVPRGHCGEVSARRHYCTLARGHRGDHLTLLERWPHQPYSDGRDGG